MPRILFRIALAAAVVALAGCASPAAPGSAPPAGDAGGGDTGIHKICEEGGDGDPHDVTAVEFTAATGLEVAGTPSCVAYVGTSYEYDVYVAAYATDDAGLVETWYDTAVEAGWTTSSGPSTEESGAAAFLYLGDGGNGGNLSIIWVPDYTKDRPGQGITGPGLTVTVVVPSA